MEIGAGLFLTVVISDFEPVTSWSSRLNNLFLHDKKPSIGIAHQYSYERNVPKASGFLMRKAHSLARAKTRLGLHFKQEGILPPFIAQDIKASESVKDKILVYLGFDDLQRVMEFLKQQIIILSSNLNCKKDHVLLDLPGLKRFYR